MARFCTASYVRCPNCKIGATDHQICSEYTVFIRVFVAPKHKTHPNFCLDLLVSGHIVISYPGTRYTPTFGTQFWDKKVCLGHGWIRYAPRANDK